MDKKFCKNFFFYIFSIPFLRNISVYLNKRNALDM